MSTEAAFSSLVLNFSTGMHLLIIYCRSRTDLGHTPLIHQLFVYLFLVETSLNLWTTRIRSTCCQKTDKIIGLSAKKNNIFDLHMDLQNIIKIPKVVKFEDLKPLKRRFSHKRHIKVKSTDKCMSKMTCIYMMLFISLFMTTCIVIMKLMGYCLKP